VREEVGGGADKRARSVSGRGEGGVAVSSGACDLGRRGAGLARLLGRSGAGPAQVLGRVARKGEAELGCGEEMGQRPVGPAGGSWASRRKGLRAEN